MHGWSLGRILVAEVADARPSAVATVAGIPIVATGLWIHNGLAAVTTLVAAVAALWAGLLLPVLASHVVGTLVAARRSMAQSLRGARPSGAIVVVAQIARVPALLLLVAAVFDLTGAVAVARTGSAERELRAAGDTVHLWVTPDPRPIGTQSYWDRIGVFAGQALDRHDALLSAAVEVSTGVGSASIPALVVDAEYLRLQDVRAEDGTRITATDRVSVWLPAGSGLRRDPLLRALAEWELRDAPERVRDEIGGGSLTPAALYSYPGDSTSRTWFDNAVLVVVPEPSAVFSADQLGSWLSSGDVVFTTRARAEQSLRSSDVAREISAVVDVGQVAAERARTATTAVSVGAVTVASSVLVSVVLMLLATATHRRRNGRAVFARFAAGVSHIRTDAGPLAAETALLLLAAAVTINTWFDLQPDGTGRRSGLDPVVQSSTTAGALAVSLVLALSAVSITALAVTARRVTRTRGNGAR